MVDDHDHGNPLHISTVQEMEEAEKKYPGPMEFCHHHVHTHFSTLDGVATPKDYVDRAKHFGMDSISCTDHGSLGALPDMFAEADKAGIKFIPGIEAYWNQHHQYWSEQRANGVTIASIREQDPELADNIRSNRHLIVLAKNDAGFKSLLNLTSDSWEQGFYFKPRIWMDAIKKNREGLILLSGCINGPISYEIMKSVQFRKEGDTDRADKHLGEAIKWARDLKEEFAEHFFFELQMPGPDIWEGYEVLRISIQIAKQLGIQTVLTGDTHYLHKEDWDTQRALMAVAQGKTIDDPDLFMADTCEGYLKSRAEFRQTFYEQGYDKFCTINDIEEACDGTLAVAEMCEGFKPDLSPKLPEISGADQKLAQLVAADLIRRGLHTSVKRYYADGRMVTHTEQVEIELERMSSKGFSSYFLITKDLCDYSRSQGWPVAPGRGSAPGSLVCYLLGITDLDPLKWGLSFDRFLSPSRGGYMLKCTME